MKGTKDNSKSVPTTPKPPATSATATNTVASAQPATAIPPKSSVPLTDSDTPTNPIGSTQAATTIPPISPKPPIASANPDTSATPIDTRPLAPPIAASEPSIQLESTRATSIPPVTPNPPATSSNLSSSTVLAPSSTVITTPAPDEAQTANDEMKVTDHVPPKDPTEFREPNGEVRMARNTASDQSTGGRSPKLQNPNGEVTIAHNTTSSDSSGRPSPATQNRNEKPTLKSSFKRPVPMTQIYEDEFRPSKKAALNAPTERPVIAQPKVKIEIKIEENEESQETRVPIEPEHQNDGEATRVKIEVEDVVDDIEMENVERRDEVVSGEVDEELHQQSYQNLPFQ
ncbi:hypothetical protein VTL71DRAFT_4359 [Oculimacula yallundae]|uniref:Uncharacterized protein n=1 Tax=Oculimacula yallundae TaxID=86028 RepID=A0ABR4C2C4_9HELO